MALLQVFTFIASLVAFSMFIWTIRLIAHNVRARIFLFLALAICIYIFGYSKEIIQDNLQGVIYWIHMEYIGIAFIPPILFILSLHINRFRENDPVPLFWYVVFIPSIIVFIAQWTFPTSTLYYRSITLEILEPVNQLRIEKGPIYYLHILQTILSLFFSFFLLMSSLKRSREDNRKGTIGILIGISIPALAFLLYIFSIVPWGIDPVPYAFALVSPILAFGVYSENILSDLLRAKSTYYKHSIHPVFIFNSRDFLIDVNRKAEELFPFLRDYSWDQPWPILQKRLVEKDVRMETHDDRVEVNYQGRVYLYHSFTYTNRSGKKHGKIRSLQEITQLKEAMRVMEVEANQDGLTGLLTRRKWEELLELNLKQSKRFSHPGTMVLIDLDKFKNVNDKYGHPSGDDVLKEVSRRLQDALRDIDILGRYGGEELCLWLTETPPEQALTVAERLRIIIEEASVQSHGNEIYVTASFGLYGCHRIEQIAISYYVRKADKALYLAKDKGRNRVEVFSEE